MKRDRVYDLCAITFIVALCFTYTFLIKEVIAIDGDAGDGYWAVMAGNARTFMNGEFPLWSPYLWGGYTNAGSIFGCFYPIFYLLYIIFWDSSTQMLSYHFLTAVYFIHLSIFGCGIYTLEKRLTNNKLLSWVCAVLATFCGCTLWGYHWAYIFIGFSWMPFFLYAYLNTLEQQTGSNKKWIVTAAVILAMVGLGSTSHGLLFLAVCMFFFFLSFTICNREKFFFYTKMSLIIGFLGIGLCAFQLLPFVQSMKLSYRYVNSLSGVLDYEVYMSDIVPASDMHQFLGQHVGWYAMSLLLFLMAILAFKLKTNKNRELQMFAKIMFVFTICMASGAFLPDLTWHIPGIKQMREQFLWVPYMSVSCSILAGVSLNYLSNNRGEEFRRKISAIDAIVLLLFIIALLPENNSINLELFIKILIFVIAFIGFITKISRKLRRRIVYILLCLYTILDFVSLVILTQNRSIMTADEAAFKVNEVNITTQEEFDSLICKKGERILTWSPSRAYPSNIASVIGYYDCAAYMNPIYEKNWDIHKMNVPLRSLLQNIKYVFVSENNEETFLDWMNNYMNYVPNKMIHLYSDYEAMEKTGVFVYENDTLGSAWIVREYETYEDSDAYEDIFDRLGQIDIKNKCLMNSNCSEKLGTRKFDNINGSVDVNIYDANHVQYICHTDEKAILVTSDILYPGWKVYVDGKKRDILEVNYAFRGVCLEAGNHTVDFRFQPDLVILGSIIGLLAGIVCIFLICQNALKKLKKERVLSDKY